MICFWESRRNDTIGGFFLFLFTGAQVLKLPIGILMPLVVLSVNLSLPRPAGVAGTFFYGITAVVLYAISGWFTGWAVGWIFNLVAKRMGGIDAKFVTTLGDALSSFDTGD